MFWRRRRTDNFDWHTYVRTTIKLRREKRRQQLDDAKALAAEQADRLRRSSVEGARQSGNALVSGVRRLAVATVSASKRALSFAAASIRAAGHGIGSGLQKIPLENASSLFRHIRVSQSTAGLLAIISAVLALSVTAQIFLEGHSLISIAAAAVLWSATLGLALRASSGILRTAPFGLRLPKFSFNRVPARTLAALAAVVTVVAVGGGAIAFLVPAVSVSLPSMPTLVSLEAKPPEVIEGRANAVSGDTIVIGDKLIRIAGIEAPEMTQRCTDARGRSWRCGRTARNALRRIVRRRSVTCTVESISDAGLRTGACTVRGDDIGARLVLEGRVFATGGILTTRYSDEAAEARREKRGIWRGESQTPADFRRAMWEQASEAAPGGCPIKGRKDGEDSGTYVVPWSSNYERTTVRSERGDRWFCSEAEAISAGLQPEPSS